MDVSTPSKQAIWMVGPMAPAVAAGLQENFQIIEAWKLSPDSEQARYWREQVRFVATSGRIGIDAELIASLPKLEVVVSFGVGYDTIDIQALQARGIAFSNTPGVLDECVADSALALMLAVSRKVVVADRFVRQGQWPQGDFGLASKVSGKRCGIMGLGNIGLQIARRASAFDMEIHYCNRKPNPDAPADYIYHADVRQLAEQVDFLVLALPGGANTRHIINQDVLEHLGSKGILINVARGSVVNEQDLIQALQTGTIAAAGLDVYEHEPQVPQALLEMDQVVLLPHISSGTHETRQAMADLVVANAVSWLQAGRLLTPVY